MRTMKRWVLMASWAVSAVLISGLTLGAPSEHSATFRHEAVAADHFEASRAGAEVLAAGGNAADAAAATMLALGVVNPASSGLGGGGFALYYSAKDGSLTFLDFRERAPRAADATMFEAEREPQAGPASAPSQLGGLAAGVPGEPAGIEALVHRLGQLPLEAVIAPALRLAEEVGSPPWGNPEETRARARPACIRREGRSCHLRRHHRPRNGRFSSSARRRDDTE